MAGALQSTKDSLPGPRPRSKNLNDGDAEKRNDHDFDNRTGDHEDGDADSSEEYESTGENGRYHDEDDIRTLTIGRRADAPEALAIASVVERYFAAAASDDGRAACSLMAPSFERAVPEDYGRSALGPRGVAAGCAQVASTLFAREARQLSGKVAVTGVRLQGSGEGLALIGSPTMPASTFAVQRDSDRWRIDSLIGVALP